MCDILHSDRIYYVRIDGDDNNDGCQNTPSSAFRTIQQAVDTALRLHWNGFSVSIHLQSGTLVAPAVFDGSVSISGAARGQKTPLIIRSTDYVFTNTFISATGDAIAVAFGGWVRVSGFTLRSSEGSCINVTNGGRCDYGNVSFGSAGYMHVNVAGTGSQALAVANFSIAGSAQGFVHITNGAFASLNDVTAYLTGAVAFGVYFAGLACCAVLQAYRFVTSGAASGPRFTVHKNSIIDTDGQPASNYFPGSSAGVEATGGRWV